MLHEDQVELGRAINEFRGNDFTNMKLIDVAFRTGIDLTQQSLPTGPDYVFISNAKNVLPWLRREVEAWPDPDTRKCALILIDIWLEELREGQEQVFFQVADPNRDFREAKVRLRNLVSSLPSSNKY